MFSEILEKYGATETNAFSVYSDLFQLDNDYIQNENEKNNGRANPVGYYKNENEEKGHFRIFFKDTFKEILQELQRRDFAILNGLTYYGRTNKQDHAGKMFAMIFDYDGITKSNLENFLHGTQSDLNKTEYKLYPAPNYIIESGHGLHLYYLFETPIELYPYTKLKLKELKYSLTEKIWNGYTSELKPQEQGINQGFRVIGGKTKTDAPNKVVKAYKYNVRKWTLDELCEYVPGHITIDQTKQRKESKYTLQKAKELYPEWYQRVVIEKDTNRRYWDIAGKTNGTDKHALYHWWIEKIKSGTTYGHRYFALMCLCIYAIKCDVDEIELRNDIYNLLPTLNEKKAEKPMSENDILSALECYDIKYKTFPRKDIEKLSAIPIPPNKRNGRKQKAHVRYMNLIRDFKSEEQGKTIQGRPKGTTELLKVRSYRAQHQNATPKQCMQDLRLNKNTVYKYWGKTKKGRPANAGTKQDLIQKYRAEHQNATPKQCMQDLGLNKNTVYKWWNGTQKAGRPANAGTKQELIQRYRKIKPNATKTECINDLGISKPTVYKWWNS